MAVRSVPFDPAYVERLASPSLDGLVKCCPKIAIRSEREWPIGLADIPVQNFRSGFNGGSAVGADVDGIRPGQAAKHCANFFTSAASVWLQAGTSKRDSSLVRNWSNIDGLNKHLLFLCNLLQHSVRLPKTEPSDGEIGGGILDRAIRENVGLGWGGSRNSRGRDREGSVGETGKTIEKPIGG